MLSKRRKTRRTLHATYQAIAGRTFNQTAVNPPILMFSFISNTDPAAKLTLADRGDVEKSLKITTKSQQHFSFKPLNCSRQDLFRRERTALHIKQVSLLSWLAQNRRKRRIRVIVFFFWRFLKERGRENSVAAWCH